MSDMSHIIRKSPELISITRQNLYKSLSLTGATKTNNYDTTNLYYNKLKLPVQQVIRFAGLPPEQFGNESERLLIRELGLQPTTAPDYDGILELTGHRIEIKCARYKISSAKLTPLDLKYKWTRINPLAEFDLILLALLDWDGFCIRILDRQQVIDLAEQIHSTRRTKNSSLHEKQTGKFVIHRDDLLGVKPSI